MRSRAPRQGSALAYTGGGNRSVSTAVAAAFALLATTGCGVQRSLNSIRRPDAQPQVVFVNLDKLLTVHPIFLSAASPDAVPRRGPEPGRGLGSVPLASPETGVDVTIQPSVHARKPAQALNGDSRAEALADLDAEWRIKAASRTGQAQQAFEEDLERLRRLYLRGADLQIKSDEEADLAEAGRLAREVRSRKDRLTEVNRRLAAEKLIPEADKTALVAEQRRLSAEVQRLQSQERTRMEKIVALDPPAEREIPPAELRAARLRREAAVTREAAAQTAEEAAARSKLSDPAAGSASGPSPLTAAGVGRRFESRYPQGDVTIAIEPFAELSSLNSTTLPRPTAKLAEKVLMDVSNACRIAARRHGWRVTFSRGIQPERTVELKSEVAALLRGGLSE